MTPLEMLQEFQLHYDKVDADGLPRMYPEEVFLFLNDAQEMWVSEARKHLEENTQLSEDASSLVVDAVVSGESGEETTFYRTSLIKQKGYESPDDPYLPYRYFLMGHCQGSIKGKSGKVSLREVTHNEWEATIQNPHTSPRPFLCPYRFVQDGVLVGKPTNLTLGKLYLTVVIEPTPISANSPCILKPQLHRPLVMKAVELAHTSIERGTQLTRGQA